MLHKNCQLWTLNLSPLISEANSMPTMPQSSPKFAQVF